MALAKAVERLVRDVGPCSTCGMYSVEDPCLVCTDPRRDAATILVVEQTRDCISLEETGAYRGVYHVLGGHIDHVAGEEAEHLRIDRLVERVRAADTNSRAVPVIEIILGLNPTLEGDATAALVTERLRSTGVRLSRLARGLPTGTQLEYANRAVLSDAIAGRSPVAPD